MSSISSTVQAKLQELWKTFCEVDINFSRQIEALEAGEDECGDPTFFELKGEPLTTSKARDICKGIQSCSELSAQIEQLYALQAALHVAWYMKIFEVYGDVETYMNWNTEDATFEADDDVYTYP